MFPYNGKRFSGRTKHVSIVWKCDPLASLDFSRISRESQANSQTNRLLVLAHENDRALLRTAAAAIASWHREHGGLPPDLDALVPDFLPSLPLDALTGLPLGYEPDPDASSFVLRARRTSQRDNPIRFFLAPPPDEN